MDFENLLKAAKSNERFRQIIARNQLKSQKIRLDDRIFVISSNNLYGDFIDFDEHHLITNRLDIISDTFSLFGHSITKLNFFVDNLKADVIETICTLINQYASESLAEVALINVKGNLLEHWTNLFENVHSLRLLGMERFEDTKIHHIFPNLNRLEIKHNNPVNLTKLLEHDFRQLTQFTYTGHLDQEQNLQHFIELNGQLRDVDIRSPFESSFLEFISQMLPALNSLAVVLPRKIDRLIRFENLQHFSLTTRFTQDFNENFPFKFDRLESFAWFTNEVPTAWLKAISAIETLRKFELPYTLASYELLRDIADDMIELTEMGAKWSGRQIDGIVKLMGETITLKRATVSVELNLANRTELIEYLSSRWVLIDDRTEDLLEYFVFQRQLNY